MRDGYVIQQMRDLEGKVSNDLGNILEVCGVMEARVKSLERVLFGTRFALLKLALIQVFSPALVRKTINRIFSQFHQAQAKAVHEARKNATKKILTPAPLAVLSVLVAMLFAGCVPNWKYIHVKNELAIAQLSQKAYADMAQYCQDQQIRLVDVLRKFNQIDDKGQLRNAAKPDFKMQGSDGKFSIETSK